MTRAAYPISVVRRRPVFDVSTYTPRVIEEVQKAGRRRELYKKLVLLLISCAVGFLLIETGYRLFDPYPHYPRWEINRTEHGNLSEFDESLGWKGTPSARERFVTHNAEVLLRHNRLGFRDVEPDERSASSPALIFLGDSFTWGYEVEFDEMFVSKIRERLPEYEVFNLAHRGYGTDQALLTLRRWHDERPVERVVLMFSENDPDENNSDYQYSKHKPKFDVVEGQLQLTGVPVPRGNQWRTAAAHEDPKSLVDVLANLVYQSHFLHDLRFRSRRAAQRAEPPTVDAEDMDLTRWILRALRDEVAGRGARLALVAIPSKLEFMSIDGYVPYQVQLRPICSELDIDYLDLAPFFERRRLRTYFRGGMHWNARGHTVAAEAILEFLNDGD